MFGFEIVEWKGTDYWHAESTAIRRGRPLWGPTRYDKGVILRAWKGPKYVAE